MAMTLEELKVIINAEISPLKGKMKEMENTVKASTDKVKNSLDSIKNTTKGLVAALAGIFAAKQLFDLGKYSTAQALEVEASMNQIKRTMGESTQAFLKWAENNANAFNMSTGEAVKYGAVYSNLFAGFIKDTNKLSAYTAKMLETSAIVANGTGRTMTDVMERIRSGLLGNTEAIEDLGIMVNVSMIESTEAFKRFANGQSWQQLDFQTQQQIRLMAILEQASARFGDTLEGSVNGSIALFKALLKDSALNIGNAFLPVIDALMPILNTFAAAVKYVTAKLAELVQLLFNKRVSSKDGVGGAVSDATKGLTGAKNAAGDLADNLGDAGSGAGDLAKGADNAGKAAKKAAKELRGLMGFDEINLLNKNSASDAGTGGGSGGSGGKGKGGGKSPRDILPDLEITDRGEQYNTMFDGLLEKLKPLKEFLEHLWNLFKLGWTLTFHSEGIDRLKQSLEGIKNSISDIFDDGLVLTTAKTFMEKLGFALGQGAGAIANVGLGIAILLAESINKSLQETKLDIKTWLMRSFLNVGDIFASMGNVFSDLSDIFYQAVTSEPATDIGGNIISTLTYATMGISDLGWKLGRDLWAGIETVISENKGKIIDAFTGFLNALTPITDTIKNAVRDAFSILNRVYDEHVKPFIDSFFSGYSQIYGTLLDGWNNYINPVLTKLGEKFSKLYDEHIKPAMESIGKAIGNVFGILKGLWENLLQPLFNWIASVIFPILAPIVEFLGNRLLSVIEFISDRIKAVMDIFNGLIDFITGVFTGNWEQAWEGVKQIFSGVWELITGTFQLVWDNIMAIFEPIVDWFSEKWNSVVEAVQNAFEPIVDWFSSKWEAIKGIYNVVATYFKTIFSQAWDNIVNVFKIIGQWFSDRWNDVKNILSPVASWFKEQFQNAWNNLTNIFKSIGSWFGQRWSDVKNALSSVSSWFGSIFTSAYNAVKNAFSGIVGFFSGIWSRVQSVFVNAGQRVANAVGGAFRSAVNAVLGTVEGIVNGFVRMINGVLSVVNSIIPGSGVGYVSGISLPRLARGGIVDSPTIAMIGEAGKEAVVPLENTGFLQTMGRVVSGAVVNALGMVDGKGSSLPSGDIVIQIGGSEFGRIAIDEINKEQERVGETLIKI